MDWDRPGKLGVREGTGGGGVIIVDWDRPGKLGVREGTGGGGYHSGLG